MISNQEHTGLAPNPMAELPAVLPSEDYIPKAMPRLLGPLNMTMTFLMIIFFVNLVPSAVAGGPAAFTYWVLCGLGFFIPCSIATAQLGVLFRHEGALYNWTHKALGGYWSFFSGFCAWLSGVLVIIPESSNTTPVLGHPACPGRLYGIYFCNTGSHGASRRQSRRLCSGSYC